MAGKSYALIEPETKRIVTQVGGKIKIGKIGDKPMLFTRWLNCQEVRDEINKSLAVEYHKRNAKVSPHYFINYEVNEHGYVHLVGQNEWLYIGAR